MLQQNLGVSYRADGLLHSIRRHPSPIESIQQHGELRCTQMNDTVADRRPGKPTLLQPLRDQHHAAAVPRQQLDPVRTLRAENKHVAAVWVGAQCFGDQRRKGMNRFPEVDRLRGHQNLQVGAKRDHEPPLTAANTVASAAASTPCSTQIRAPQTSISIRPSHPPATAAFSGGLALTTGAGPAASIRTGTNLGALTPAACATWRRHTVNNPRTTPCRRATSDMFAPSSKLSATIPAFSSAVHRRRRRCPVISSTRRYAPSSCLASSMAFAIASPPTISLCKIVLQVIHAIGRWGPDAGYQ